MIDIGAALNAVLHISNHKELYKLNLLILNLTQNLKTASLHRQEPQTAGPTKLGTTLRFGKIFGTTSVVKSRQNPRDVVTFKNFKLKKGEVYFSHNFLQHPKLFSVCLKAI